jgi:glycosyltransferase involved in cell wall biosynthesis
LIRSDQSSGALHRSSVTPRISLVTPCLNQAELVRQTLASVLDQHYPNLEYVVIDGGSTDGSADVIAETESHLSHWVSEPDDGHYAALNKGFAKTTGEVMGYLNGDDLLFPKSLFVVAEIFARFPEVQWLTGAHLAVDAHGRYPGYVRPMRWTRWHLLSRQVPRFLPQESTFWRRTLWEQAGGKLDHRFALAADFELWARFSRITSPYTVDAPIGCFRFVRGQRSVAFRAQYLAEVQSIRDRERALSKTDERAIRMASILLRASGGTSVRGKVDTMLGAHALIVFDRETHQFRLRPPSTRARRAQRLFALLAGTQLSSIGERSNDE